MLRSNIIRFFTILTLLCSSVFCNITPYEADLIDELIHKMATKSVPYLIYHRDDFRSLGDKIQHISPIYFFSHILDSPIRKNELQIILKGFFTCTQFVDEATIIFTNYDKQKLQEELMPFCQTYHKNYQTLNFYTKKRDWKNLIFQIAK